MRFRIQLKSFDQAVRKLEAMARMAGDPKASGTRIMAEAVKTTCNASGPGRGVPVDQGVLRASGRAEGPDARGRSLLTYGGAAAGYALIQHEGLHLRHRIGEPRWLIRGLERVVGERNAVLRALRFQADAVIRAGLAQQ